MDFGCQVRISGPPSFSVYTSTSDPMLVPTSSDVGTSMDRDRVEWVVVHRDIACNTDPLPSLPVEEDTVDEEDIEKDEVVVLPPPGEEENVLPAKELPDQEGTFKDVVSFVRELYGLGPLMEVAGKGLDSRWSRSLRGGNLLCAASFRPDCGSW